MKVRIVKKLLADNEKIANENRLAFREKGIYCINVMSGPGSGKTTMLERTLPYLTERHGLRVGVIEGDVEGDLDGARLDRLGAPVVQLNTSGACHLDATMIQSGVEELEIDGLDLLVVENVGNLVCPAGFDLGEDAKVVLLSVPEGDDKPVKYPAMFKKADVLLINKIDLAPHLDFSEEQVRSVCLRLKPELVIMSISARTGEGIEAWGEYVAAGVRSKKGGA